MIVKDKTIVITGVGPGLGREAPVLDGLTLRVHSFHPLGEKQIKIKAVDCYVRRTGTR